MIMNQIMKNAYIASNSIYLLAAYLHFANSGSIICLLCVCLWLFLYPRYGLTYICFSFILNDHTMNQINEKLKLHFNWRNVTISSLPLFGKNFSIWTSCICFPVWFILFFFFLQSMKNKLFVCCNISKTSGWVSQVFLPFVFFSFLLNLIQFQLQR